MTLNFSVAMEDLQRQNSEQVEAMRQSGLADLLVAQTRPAATRTTAEVSTMFAVASKFKVTVEQLKLWNPTIDPNAMPVDTELWLIDPVTVPDVGPAPDPPPDPEPEPPPEPVPSKLVLGHVALHGTGSWLDKARALEQKFGKFQGPMRHYFSVNSSGLLTSDHKSWMDSDPVHSLLPNWKPGPDWAGAGVGSNVGVIQSGIRSWLPYILSGQIRRAIIWHEPENDGQPLSNYIPMWKRVHAIIKDLAPDLELGFCSISYFPGTTKDTAYYEQNFYAGPEYVDYFAPDPYTRKSAPPSRLPENMINQAKVLRALPGAADKKVVAAEWGGELGGGTADRGTDQYRADCITAVKNALPQLIAVGYDCLTYYDDGSDYLSASGPDVAAYKSLKTATEAL